KEDDTALLTFEGASFRGRVLDGEASGPTWPPFLSPPQVAAYAAFCRDNLAALLLGAAARYSFVGAPDGNVSGLVLSVGAADAPARFQVSHISLRPAVPLQATLFQLTQAAAQALAGRGLGEWDLRALPVGLTVLYDPAMHGSAGEPDLRGLDVRRRAVLVM